MSASDDDDVGMGDMFGGPDVEAPPRPDIEFEVDRSEWLHEGTTAPGFSPTWPTASRSRYRECLRPLKLFQKDKHHSLWGHRIWNAAKLISKRMDQGLIPVEGLSVLELGSGLGVPSLVAHQCGARLVVVTDYPDTDLISILERNVVANRLDEEVSNGASDGSATEASEGEAAAVRYGTIHAVPLLWGKTDHIKHVLELTGGTCGFDLLILSDIVFNHVCHDDLLRTIATCLSKDRRSAAYCAFSHHRPHKQREDMQFFEKLGNYGLTYVKVDMEHYPLMFPDDPGPAEIRMPVHCFKIQHVFDDAGPPVDMLHAFDVVVDGTGLTETLVSAALSRHGLKVLHLDRSSTYGGCLNTLHPEAFLSFISQHNQFDEVRVSRNAFHEETHGPLRAYQLDTIPQTFLSKGPMVRKLIESETARNMEFQAVDRVALVSVTKDCATPSLRLHRMPLSRSDVFSSKDFSPLEMRRLMKFVKDVEAHLAEHYHASTQPSSAPSDQSATSGETNATFKNIDMKEGETFPAFLIRRYQLSEKSVHLLTLFGLLQVPSGGVEGSVNLLRTFLTSVGVYGCPAPYLVPSYGCAELPQCMCRASAVWDGTFVLRRGVVSTWRDDKKAFVVLTNGQRLETKALICPRDTISSDSPQFQPTASLLRCVVVLTEPLVQWSDMESQLNDLPADEKERLSRAANPPLLVLVGGIPRNRSDSNSASSSVGDKDVIPVHIVQQTSATLQVPCQTNAVVVHFTVERRQEEKDFGAADLDAFVDSVLHAASTTRGDADRTVLFRCSFVISETHQGSIEVRTQPVVNQQPEGEVVGDVMHHDPTHVFPVQSFFGLANDSAYLNEAEDAFHRIVNHCKVMGVDPWSRCAHPDLKVATSAASEGAAETDRDAAEFLPPPPDEVRLQMDGICIEDSDAEILKSATMKQK